MKKINLLVIFCIVYSSINAQWTNLGTSYNDVVKCMVFDSINNILYTGGNTVIKKWNGTTWTTIGNLSAPINTMCMHNGELYIAGSFTSVSSVNANYIAKWSGTAWSALGTGTNGSINQIISYNNKLVVAGNFTMAGGNMIFGLANWNGTSWSNFGQGYPYNPSGSTIWTLTVIDGELYAGGNLNLLYPTQLYSGILKYNGAWSDATGGAGQNLWLVYAIAKYNGELYTAGTFNGVANKIAKFNGSSWSGLAGGMDSTVYTLKVLNGKLYAGGAFSTAGGNTVNYIAEWNGTVWNALGSGMGVAGSQPWIFALEKYNNCLVAGGQFTKADNNTIANIAQWCGGSTNFENTTSKSIRIITNYSQNNTSFILNTSYPLIVFEIYNAAGTLIHKSIIKNSNTIIFEHTNFSNGIYLYKLISNEELISTGKFLIE